MKPRTKLLISIVLLVAVMALSAVGITAIFAAQNASVSTGFSITYIASPHVNAAITSSYAVGSYGETLPLFTTIKEKSTNKFSISFIPTDSVTSKETENVEIEIESYNYFVLSYLISNNSTIDNQYLSAKPTIVQTGYNVRYYVTNNILYDIVPLSVEGEYNSTILSSLTTSASEIPITKDEGVKICYIFFTLQDPNTTNASLTSIVWKLEQKEIST